MLLTEYTTLAEVARGLSFVDKYWDSARVAQNRGILVGSPVVDRGVTLNGVDQYVKHLLIGNEFDSDEISIVMPFWPEFEADDGVAHTLFDASLSGADDYFVQKTGANVLRVDLGNTKIRDIALNIFQPYWSVRKLNLLVVSGTSGDNNVWLISDLGVGQMLSSGGVAWSPTAPLDMWVGSIDTGVGLFAGKIGEVKIFRNMLIEQEAIDFYNGTTYCYMDQASVHLPMRACQHGPDNSRTLDVSGNNNHATFGDGVTAGTFPTKLSKRGYSTNGNDYFKTGTGLFSDTGKITVAALIDLNTASSFISFLSLEQTGGNIGCLLSWDNGTTNLRFYSGGAAAVNGANFAIGDNPSIKTVIGVHDGTDTKIYVDGVLGTNAVTPLPPNVDPNMDLTILARSSLIQFAPSGTKISDIQMYDFGLTPLQVLDLHFRMQREAGLV